MGRPHTVQSYCAVRYRVVPYGAYSLCPTETVAFSERAKAGEKSEVGSWVVHTWQDGITHLGPHPMWITPLFPMLPMLLRGQPLPLRYSKLAGI